MLRLAHTTTRTARARPNPALARSLSSRARSVLSALDLPTSGESIAGVYYSAQDGWCGSGELQASRNPATGETLAEVKTATREDVDQALKAARLAYEGWRGVAAPKRGEVLRQMRGALNDRIDDLGALVSLEMGKVLSGPSSLPPPSLSSSPPL